MNVYIRAAGASTVPRGLRQELRAQSPQEAWACYTRDWHMRRDNREDRCRWRPAALKWIYHSHFLGEIAKRYAAKLRRLKPGSYVSGFKVEKVFTGDVEDVARRVVLAREERDRYVHHSTANALTYVGRDRASPEVFYIGGLIIVPRPGQNLNPLWSLIDEWTRSRSMEGDIQLHMRGEG